MSALLEARGLVFRHGPATVVDVAELGLAPGEVLALVGPNGCGKSTLLQLLAGLLPLARGELWHRGALVASTAARRALRRRVTLVFQEPLLFDTTVAANIATGLRLRGVPKAAREARVGRVAQRLGLTELLGRSARKLSGGEAQRTALARALVLEPDVLFLDEPFASLDEATRDGLTADLGAALRQTCTAAVLVTHHLAEAVCVADSMAVMIQGALRQRGPVREVIHNPVDEAVAAVVGAEAVVEGAVVASAAGQFVLDCGLKVAGEAPLGGRVRVRIRPEDVALRREPQVVGGAANQLVATVTHVLPHGPLLRVRLDAGFALSAFATMGEVERLGVAHGARLIASIPASAVHAVRQG